MAYNLYYIVKSLILKFHEELLQLVNHCSCLGQLALSRFQLTRRLLSVGALPQDLHHIVESAKAHISTLTDTVEILGQGPNTQQAVGELEETQRELSKTQIT